MKTAFITGITGQDGAYLSRLLLDKGYKVHGLQRRASSPNTWRIDDMLGELTLHYGDMTDGSGLRRVIDAVKPDEIYNLAAQSHVQVSFDCPEYTANVCLGTMRLLECLKGSKTRFYQASTSEMFGNSPPPQNELTPFRPRSPYAIAKVAAYWTTVNYREAYGLHASNGILFNHESPLRGEEFVTRKITKAVAEIAAGKRRLLELGNLSALRDWGHAKDYVQGMWLMLQQPEPDDYVLATGESWTVQEFVLEAFRHARIEPVVGVNRNNYRPLDVERLCGDASKILRKLGWRPIITFGELVAEMVEADMRRVRDKSAV